MTIRIPGSKQKAKGSSSSRVDFPGSGASDSLSVIPTPEGFEFAATLTDATAPATYQIALDTHGLVATIDADGYTIDLSDPAAADPKAIVGTISAPSVRDGSGAAAPASVVSVALDSKAKALRKGETLVAYTIDPSYLDDHSRLFPVVLDPSVCIHYGDSGCQSTSVSDASIVSPAARWNNDRAGDFVGTDQGTGHAERTLLWFSLPDLLLAANAGEGAAVTSASLTLRQMANVGTAGSSFRAEMNGSGFDPNSVIWSGPGTTTPVSPWVLPCGSYDCALSFDLTAMAQAWYVRSGAARTNFGLAVVSNSAASEELQFEKVGSGAVSPVLTVNYVPGGYKMTFDPLLGPDFAPSSMVAGRSVTLPIDVTNVGSANAVIWNNCGSQPSDCWSVGYRWFDSKGTPAGSGKTTIGTQTSPGSQTGWVNLAVTPPSNPGQYTIRLDMVHTVNGADLWMSDWAQPSLYYARAKVSSSPSNVHWGGLSIVEREEYPIAVVASAVSGGAVKSTTLPDGSTASIDLWTHNLIYSGSTGLGFADLGTNIGLGYYYSAGDRNSLPGTTKAAGWYTNYDERIEPGTGGATYMYRDPSGNVYPVNTTGDGALASGAPVRVDRQAVTVMDENLLPGAWSGGTPNLSTSYASNGTHSYSIPASAAGAGAYIDVYASPAAVPTTGAPKISLNAYPTITFNAKTDSDPGAGFGINITDTTTNVPHWFVYTVGADWSLPAGYYKLNVAQSPAAATGVTVTDNLLQSASSAFGSSIADNYVVNSVALIGRGGAGNDYFDAIQFAGRAWSLLGVSAWTRGSSSRESSDVNPTNPMASPFQVAATDFAGSPQCDGCVVNGSTLSTAVGSYPYVGWSWKQVGGSTIGVAFKVKDSRTGVENWMTYYSGVTPPQGAPNPVQVSPGSPTNWTPVVRNLLEDFKAALRLLRRPQSGRDQPVRQLATDARPGNADRFCLSGRRFRLWPL